MSTIIYRLHGSLKPTYSKIGCQRAPSYGSTVNVSSIHISRVPPHGLPICVAGSGKSIIWFVIFSTPSPVPALTLITSSAIIQHITALRNDGRATLAYFYFDFRDEEKQNLRKSVACLLVQLSAYSKPCCDIIYHLYSVYGKGVHQPSNRILIDCLKEMLTVVTPHPIFIIMDALDECPDDTGIPTPREAVLNLLKDLVDQSIPNLYICVTSRPEIDIQTKLKPLAVYAISLHEERRQKFVIASYVSLVVSSDEHMREWRDEDKTLAIEELSEHADGM